MQFWEGEGFFLGISLALEARSILSPAPMSGELAEKGCVCSFVLFSHAKDSSFSCVAIPPLQEGEYCSEVTPVG